MMPSTTNGIAPIYKAVPELRNEERLAIVQQQLRALIARAYTLEAAVTATPQDAQQHGEFVAELAYVSSTLSGYRTIEAELIARLST